jgi:hypothetical protein
MTLPKYNDRRFELYFPSAEDLKRWKSIAEAAKMPLAKWIYETVEQHQAIKEAGLRTDQLKELADLKEEVQQLRGMVRIKDTLLQKLETELYKSKYAVFEDAEVEGITKYDEELIKVLKRGKTIEGHAILRELGIDPKDSQVIRLLKNQLEILRNYGLVTETSYGWRWIG